MFLLSSYFPQSSEKERFNTPGRQEPRISHIIYNSSVMLFTLEETNANRAPNHRANLVPFALPRRELVFGAEKEVISIRVYITFVRRRKCGVVDGTDVRIVYTKRLLLLRIRCLFYCTEVGETAYSRKTCSACCM